MEHSLTSALISIFFISMMLKIKAQEGKLDVSVQNSSEEMLL
jgi:hypothetical protein